MRATRASTACFTDSRAPTQRGLHPDPAKATIERVVLVDRSDTEIGSEEKLRAHQAGLLHRAFSVFVFHPSGALLLQKRAADKYHSGGLWSNTCCGHPRPGKELRAEAQRRLQEEMGIECTLEEVFDFQYRSVLRGGLTENELDHVFIGVSAEEPVPDPAEVEEWRWRLPREIEQDLADDPNAYTAWFPLAWRGLMIHSRQPRPDARPARD